MKYPLIILVFFMAIFLLLAACSNKRPATDAEDKTKEKQSTSLNEKKDDPDKDNIKDSSGETKIEVEPLPKTYYELAQRPVGKYVDFDFDLNEDEKVLKTFKELPDISSNPDQQELDNFYNELLKMVQQGFKGPEETIRQLRFQSLGNPQIGVSRYQFKENMNVEIILDASGSMAQSINGKSKMDAAKDSINQFVRQLPKEAKVAIRVYGHKGSGSDNDKKLSCSSSEIMYPISNYDEGNFKSALNKIQPKGWTPIGLALREAKKDLSKYDGANNTNIVYLVSDGVATCDEDPIQAAKELYDSSISPIINVIGFDLDNEGQNQLKQIADTTEGIYENVTDENGLQEEFKKLGDMADEWKKWKEGGEVKLESKKLDNSLAIFVYITDEDVKATNERVKIGMIMSVLKQNDRMSPDSYEYLTKKNGEYHQWIKGEIENFKEELKALNDKSYTEALKALEDKYEKNTQ